LDETMMIRRNRTEEIEMLYKRRAEEDEVKSAPFEEVVFVIGLQFTRGLPSRRFARPRLGRA
jgi:hypothetical protein